MESDYTVSDETLDTVYPLARAVAGEGQFPSLVMEHDGYVFGSVMVTLRKSLGGVGGEVG